MEVLITLTGMPGRAQPTKPAHRQPCDWTTTGCLLVRGSEACLCVPLSQLWNRVRAHLHISTPGWGLCVCVFVCHLLAFMRHPMWRWAAGAPPHWRLPAAWTFGAKPACARVSLNNPIIFAFLSPEYVFAQTVMLFSVCPEHRKMAPEYSVGHGYPARFRAPSTYIRAGKFSVGGVIRWAKSIDLPSPTRQKFLSGGLEFPATPPNIMLACVFCEFSMSLHGYSPDRVRVRVIHHAWSPQHSPALMRVWLTPSPPHTGWALLLRCPRALLPPEGPTRTRAAAGEPGPDISWYHGYMIWNKNPVNVQAAQESGTS